MKYNVSAIGFIKGQGPIHKNSISSPRKSFYTNQNIFSNLKPEDLKNFNEPVEIFIEEL